MAANHSKNNIHGKLLSEKEARTLAFVTCSAKENLDHLRVKQAQKYGTTRTKGVRPSLLVC